MMAILKRATEAVKVAFMEIQLDFRVGPSGPFQRVFR